MKVELTGDIRSFFPPLVVDSVLTIGTGGALWGLYTAPYHSEISGINVDRAAFLAKTACQYGLRSGCFAAAYSVTRCGVQGFGRKNDWVNYVIAGAVAGATYGLVANSLKQSCRATCVLSVVCTVTCCVLERRG